MLTLDGPWFTTYLALELECDQLILEALQPYYSHIEQELARFPGREHIAWTWDWKQYSDDVLLALVRADGLLLCKLTHVTKIPMGDRLWAICRAAVTQNGMALAYVGEDMQIQHPELCLIAVTQNGDALQYVCSIVQARHREVCLAAVQQRGMAIIHVGEAYLTPEICWEAVIRDGPTISYVPPRLRTPELETIARQYTPGVQRLLISGDAETTYCVPQYMNLPDLDMPGLVDPDAL